MTQDALADLYSLRQPLAKKFTKKNAIHPFEDASSLEFFSEKNDAALLVFGSSSKKRPHCLTLVRTFGHRVLDMLELGLDADSFRRLAQFRGKKPAVGLRPMLVFAGPAFESTVPDEFTMAKSMLTDFFAGERGPGSDKVDVEGLQYVVVVSADEAEAATNTGLGDGSVSKPAIHLRSYLIQTKRSGQRLPRVEVSLVIFFAVFFFFLPSFYRDVLPVPPVQRLTCPFPNTVRGDGPPDGLPRGSHEGARRGHAQGGHAAYQEG